MSAGAEIPKPVNFTPTEPGAGPPASPYGAREFRPRSRVQPYRGTVAWVLQRVTALMLVVLVPLKMYTGYGLQGKVPWFQNGSPEAIHAGAAIDICLLFAIFIHALYGLRVIFIDFGWIREDKFFWRTTALATFLFCFSVYWLYIKKH